ncbi:MAG: GNAT family N-acetyltransferase [Bacteroidetes bacterium]|nr:GNAT family N-acetyltransferase [Bacteroidota bacterium]
MHTQYSQTILRHAEEDTPATPTVEVSAVDSPREFDSLQKEWNALLEKSDARIFQTFEWQRTWWRLFGEPNKHARLLIILVREGGALIGIAPLYVERVTVLGPVAYRRLSFTGRGVSDYLDILIERGQEDRVFAHVAGFLARHKAEFDTVLLEDIHDGSLSHDRLGAALRASGFSGDKFLSEYCPRTFLRETWKDTVATFPSAHRNRLMKRMKVVTEDFHAEFERVTDLGAVDTAMDDFIRMHQARWNVIGHQGVFAESTTLQFHREVAPLLMKRGWLLLAFLKMQGKRFVGDYGLIYGTECSTYLGGEYDAGEVNRFSPGNVLLMHIMRECHTLGIHVYDFMRGTERYKYTLGAVNVPNWTLLMFSPGRSLAPVLHKSRLLRDALVRRSVHEWSYLLHHARKHGFFSKGFVSYVVKRCGTILADALQKAREPEKSLVIGRDQQ